MSESNEINDTDSEDQRLVSNPVLKIFLEGLYDKDCHLSKLRGCPYLVMRIWKEVRNFWREKIILPTIKVIHISTHTCAFVLLFYGGCVIPLS